MIVLVLTGSIGMGKSTTLAMFAEAGAAVWDADAAVHRLYEPGGAGAEAVRALFGGDVLGPGGGVDRTALGRIVLGDREALRRLEAGIHPLVAADRARFIEEARARSEAVAVLDIPLFFEGGGDRTGVDGVVLVTADEAVRRARVLARPGMGEEKLAAILARQMPETERTARADHVIRTDEGLPAAREAVARVLADVRNRH